MSSKCILTIKNENWLKRELTLYQHTDGHPNSMMMSLVRELRDIYNEFREHGDPDWFLDPGKLSGILIVRSAPVMTEDMKSLLKTLNPATKSRLESNLFLGLPTLMPEVRVSDVNYEYSILLRESEDFFGYTMEIYRLQNNKRYSVVNVIEENFKKDKLEKIIAEESFVDSVE